MVRSLIIIIPAVLLVLIPLVYSVLIAVLPTTESEPPAALRTLLSAETSGHTYRQFWMDAFATLICPMLFIMVPILCSTVSASCLFAGEKREMTMETLMLSSLGNSSIFNTKVAVCTLLSTVISLIYFLIFGIAMSIADIMISAPYFFTLEWLLTLFLLMPSVSFFSVTFITFLLPKLKSSGEGMQTVGYLLLPFAVLYLLQFTGKFKVNIPIILIITAVIAPAGFVLYNISLRRFNAENVYPKGTDG